MIRLLAIAPHPGEVCKRAELKSGVQRLEEIVLVTGQNVAWPETFERARQSRP
jgi:hypothetical protein